MSGNINYLRDRERLELVLVTGRPLLLPERVRFDYDHLVDDTRGKVLLQDLEDCFQAARGGIVDAVVD